MLTSNARAKGWVGVLVALSKSLRSLPSNLLETKRGFLYFAEARLGKLREEERKGRERATNTPTQAHP